MSLSVSFTIKAPPFSINKAYYRNRQLTQEARKWREQMLVQLQTPLLLTLMQALKTEFLPSKHALSVTYDFYFPKRLLFTKKGEISKRSFDLTNIEKLLQDNLFESRYNGREIDGVVIENFDIDDKFIVDLHSRKLPHEKDHHEIRVTVALLPLSRL
jgi:hypothetical protein